MDRMQKFVLEDAYVQREATSADLSVKGQVVYVKLHEAEPKIRADERSTVREWHPKCATCGHCKPLKSPDGWVSLQRAHPCALHRKHPSSDPNASYCSDHTDLTEDET